MDYGPWKKSALLELNQCPLVYQTSACTSVSYARIHSTSVVNKRYIEGWRTGFAPVSPDSQPGALSD